MKIAYILTRGDHFGGAQIHVRDFCLRLKSLGHDPYVIIGSQGDMTNQLKEQGIPYFLVTHFQREIHPLKDLLALGGIRKILKREKFDLVSTHSSKAGILGRLAALGLKSRSVFTAHGWAFTDGVGTGKQRLYAGIERFFSLFCDRIITVSQNDFALALRFKVATSSKMRAIHNGLPLRPEVTKESIQAFSQDRPLKLIMVARFQEQKDHATLFKALETLKDQPWQCHLVGDGPLEEGYKEEARQKGFEDKVVFYHKRTDVPEMLETMDLFVLISNWEGFPRSTIEAMRASLPVIISDVGGSAEAVSPGETGFVVPQGDADAVAEKIRFFLDHPQDIKLFGDRGRQVYLESLQFDHMFEKTLAVYKEILGDLLI